MLQFPNGSVGAGLPAHAAGGGIRTPYSVVLPPGGQVVAFVRATQPSNPDAFIAANWVPTLNAGLARCRSGMGDIVVVLPGHTENVSASTFLSSLVAGTQVVGTGFGSATPTFTWSATGGQMALNKADVVLSGLRLDLGGANGVTKAILVTGTDNVIANCEIVMATSSTLDAVIGLEVGTGANRFRLLDSYVRGTTDAVTDGIKIVAAVDGLEIGGCRMMFAATEVNGLVHVTAAATNMWIHHSSFANTVASSTACIVLDDNANTGLFEHNSYSTLNNGVATAQGVIFGSGSLVRSVQCFSVDEPKKSGILTPTAGT